MPARRRPWPTALAVVPDGGRKSGRIVVETSGVSFIDSSGLRVLIELSERATALGAKVVLASPSRSMARLIELTGLERPVRRRIRRLTTRRLRLAAAAFAVLRDGYGWRACRQTHAPTGLDEQVGDAAAMLRSTDRPSGSTFPAQPVASAGTSSNDRCGSSSVVVVFGIVVFALLGFAGLTTGERTTDGR